MYRRIGTVSAYDAVLLRWYVMAVMFAGFDVKSMAVDRDALSCYHPPIVYAFTVRAAADGKGANPR